MTSLSGIRCFLAILALALGAGCGHDIQIADPEERVTIGQGLYGVAVSVNDVGNTDREPMSGFTVDVFATCPPTDMEDETLPVVATTQTEEDGFYELALDPGSYVVCTSFRRCTSVEIVAGERLGLSYEFSVGPGWSNYGAANDCIE